MNKQRIQKKAGIRRPKEDTFLDVRQAVNKAYARRFGVTSWRDLMARECQKSADKGKSS